jgi:hypothetical protein
MICDEFVLITQTFFLTLLNLLPNFIITVTLNRQFVHSRQQRCLVIYCTYLLRSQLNGVFRSLLDHLHVHFTVLCLRQVLAEACPSV